MKLYQAGAYTNGFTLHGKVIAMLTEDERRMRLSSQVHLESYHYVHKQRAVDSMRLDGVTVFLDSGAYSAYTQGSTIDINKFCSYCHRNADIIHQVSVLDVIDFTDRQAAVRKSWENLKEMERQGVNTLPCYHFGETPDALQYYVKNYPYITIGGLVGASTRQLQTWLDEVWDKYLTDDNGVPLTKVHGFGITSLPLMRRYPWYSVDSSTWVQWAANGMILLPWRGVQLNISSKSSSRKQNRQHLDTVRDVERETLEAEIIQHGGDPERLREIYQSRWAWNYWAFPEYARLNPAPETFTRNIQGLF